MAEDKAKLNRFENGICETLSNIMKQEEVNFSVFLPVLVDEVPEKSSPEYFKILKKEQMKLRRGSLSIQELHDILNIIGWEFKLTLDNKPINLVKYSLDEKVRFTDLMRISELLGIKIIYSKKVDRTPKTKP
ncbi:MAG: hypothetical protein NC200_08395 [Candidatus Gastranaerophilales bacterium]|nr:hypothetical protein [Candidatus Gastranaerophilales bacterium]